MPERVGKKSRGCLEYHCSQDPQIFFGDEGMISLKPALRNFYIYIKAIRFSSAICLTLGMHVGNNAGDSAGLLSFLGGKRKIDDGAENKNESIFSNLGSAIRWTFLLSMLLWWVPLVGQAAAGYIGGRKAGTAVRGMVVTGITALILIGIIMVLGAGIVGGFEFLNTEPSVMAAALEADFPVVGSILAALVWFMQGVASTVIGTTSLKIPIYIITVVFGFVGGAIAEMHKKEAAQSVPAESRQTFVPRSMAAHRKGKTLGFENFDDRISIQQAKIPEQKVVTVYKSLVRKVTAREEPQALAAADVPVAVQEAEERESPFAGLIHRAERNDPEKERARNSAPKEDLEFV